MIAEVAHEPSQQSFFKISCPEKDGTDTLKEERKNILKKFLE
jgi:hypothetical protein